MLLGYNFEPRNNSRALSTAGSVVANGLLINVCSYLKKPVWPEKKKIEVFGLRRQQRLDAMQAEPHSRKLKEALLIGWINLSFISHFKQ